MTSANRQQPRLQCVDVVEKQPPNLVRGGSQQCVTLSGCRCSHTFHCLSDPITFDMCHSDPVLSGTSSIVTTGIGAGGKSDCGIIYQRGVHHRSRLPVFMPPT